MAKKKVKLQFNPETLSFERVETSFGKTLKKLTLHLFSSAFIGFLFFIVFTIIIDSPDEKRLKAENERMEIQYELLNRRLEQMNDVLNDIFEKNEVSLIYLNFSDPWPKNAHAKRRLTSERFLPIYNEILSSDGEIHFKTDNRLLFEYSIESLNNYGLLLKNISLDLHNSDFKDNIMTEYEERFSKNGPIYRLEAKFKR